MLSSAPVQNKNVTESVNDSVSEWVTESRIAELSSDCVWAAKKATSRLDDWVNVLKIDITHDHWTLNFINHS